MADTVQVMIVDDSEETRQSIRMLLDFAEGMEVIAEASNGAEALHKLAVVTPDVILMDINMPVMDGAQATERISLEYPHIPVIVLSVQDDVEYVRKCMRAGAKDYLFKPVTCEQLSAAILQACQVQRHRHSRTTVAVLSERFAHRSKVSMFISSKGGVGKTTVVSNLAAALAKQGKRVAVFDMDLQFGDAAMFYNARPMRTLVDLVRECTDIDPDILDRYLTLHESGVGILSAPLRPEEAEYITAGNIRIVLQALKKRFDHVFIDTAPTISDAFFAAMETADDCFVVSTMNLAVLKNNRALLNLLQELGYETTHMKHVLNRSHSKSGIKAKDVHQILGADVFWEMDNDYLLAETSINQGVPFVLANPHHRLAKQIYTLAARLEDGDGIRFSRRSPLRKLMAARR